MRTALYRHYDSLGRLLYVGISDDPVRRTTEHGGAAPWFWKVARIEVSWFDTREDAGWAESDVIWNERPPHNKAKMRSSLRPPPYVYGVRHVATGFRSAWFTSEDDALVKLAVFEREYPDELFDLVRERGFRARETFISFSRLLSHENSHIWLGYRDMDFVPIALQDSLASAETASA